MNLVDAYRRSMIEGYRSTDPSMIRCGGVLALSYDLLESMLELPNGVQIRGVYVDPAFNQLRVVLMSQAPIEGITYEIPQGSMTPQVDLETYIERSQQDQRAREESVRTYPGYPYDRIFFGRDD